MVFEALQDPTLLLLMAAALVSWQKPIIVDIWTFCTPGTSARARQPLAFSKHRVCHMHLVCDVSATCNKTSHMQVSTVLGVAIKEEREQNAWSEGVAIWVAVIVVSLVGERNYCFSLLIERETIHHQHSNAYNCWDTSLRMLIMLP